MQPIILYDISSNLPPESKAFSGNTWKTRLALNYKGLPLKTEWVDYPDIEALYRKLGVEPVAKKPDGSRYCSLPLIYDPSTKTHVSDSYQIALYLDKTYPNTPPLFPKGTLAFHQVFQSTCTKVVFSTLPLLVATFCSKLNERSQAYFRPARERMLGGNLESLCNEAQWQKAEQAWAEYAAILAANGEGKDNLIMGDQVCFADFQIAAILAAARNALGVESEQWKRICGWQGGKWERFIDQFSKYTVMDV
ncbi:hypothetical protein EIP86_002495 [Pleurotus ostreatoroseus]|nr:hypothetical protein EIP86_002495 [Pleurotus ostreatoroseus]